MFCDIFSVSNGEVCKLKDKEIVMKRGSRRRQTRKIAFSSVLCISNTWMHDTRARKLTRTIDLYTDAHAQGRS